MADRIIVTKADLVDAAALRALEARLVPLAPHAVLRAAVSGAIAAAEVLVDQARPVSSAAAAQDHASHHHDEGAHDHLAESDITSIAIRLASPMSWPQYAEWVQWMQRAFGERLLRMKGAVLMEDGTAQSLHAVMRLFSAPVPLPALPR